MLGRPAFGAGSPSGDYLWHTDGFHLRVSHAARDRRVYSGQLVSPTAMRVTRVRLEAGDRVHLSADRRTITFAFVNHGYIDGIDVQTDCAPTLTVRQLHVGTRPLGPDHVYLGAAKAHPAAVPFTVQRAATT